MDNQHIFVSTTFAPDGTPLAAVLETCARNGIRRVELGSNHAPMADFEGLLRAFSFEYLVHNYFPIPRDSLVLNPASCDDRIRDRSRAHLLRAIDFCAATDAGLYTFHPGFITDPAGASRDAGDFDFRFDPGQLGASDYEASFERMLESIDLAVAHAAKRGVRIAVETEGSVKKSGHLLMQRPEEFARLLGRYEPDQLGINLNIGHLLLASNAFAFPIGQFVDLIAGHLVAMELSHNSGLHDEHKVLVAGAWYWKIIGDPRFRTAYKILEFRNTPVEAIRACVDLFHQETGAC